MAAAARAQAVDPAYETLTKAFDAARVRDYDTAIALFDKAATLAPTRADIHKNLAYTLLKTGDSETAREHFGAAMRLDPADLHVALEYAFLCFEARDDAPARKAEARRIFARIAGTGDATAAQAFRNIDEPLAAGIARWKSVLSGSTPTFSAHYELAQLAEQRDELDLAAASYKAAFTLLPERKSVLLELARAEKARGNPEGMTAALLAASRGGEPRAAELAREQLPDRYPYVYEFRAALELDPKNDALHRELGFLLLSMSENQQAIAEFQRIVDLSPDDHLAAAQLGLLYLADDHTAQAMPLLRKVLANGDAATANRVRIALKMPAVLEEKRQVEDVLDPRILGERSYQAGFLKDAKRYFLQAREQNPVDSSVALKLGWTNNLLHDDATALGWFDIARRSADPAVSTEAARAYANLRPGVARFQTTVWIYPAFSSRWSDVFGYGQVKTAMKWNKLRPYASLRFVGDARRTTDGPSPQSLSESAFILGVGVATVQWHGAMAWAEAGTSVSYLNGTHRADYRGGISYSRTLGTSIAAEHGGWFVETNADSVFVSRFGNDILNYSQTRAGMTSVLGSLKTQTFWNTNLTFDVQRQDWANFAEAGPGVRLHVPGTPAAMTVTISAIRGVFFSARPAYSDVRAGVWYAFTR